MIVLAVMAEAVPVNVMTGLLLAVIFGFGLLAKGMDLIYFRFSCTEPVMATVTRFLETERIARGRAYTVYTPLYRYEYQGNTLMSEGLPIYVKKRETPETVKVWLNPKEPTFVLDRRSIRYRQAVFCTPLFLVGTVGSILLVFLDRFV